MPSTPRRLGLLATSLLLAGCASSQAAVNQPAAHSPTARSASAPTAAALMVCDADIRGKVRQALALSTPPATSDSFLAGRYACTYRLPFGPLVLAVQQSDSATAAGQFFAGQQVALHGDPLAGLGSGAFGTPDGVVVVRKDSDVLTVDASGLPAVFGSQHQRRTDLAYEIASDVLGCWTGDE